MTTNYGERPGITDFQQPGDLWEAVAAMRCERDAARAEADRLRAALERVESYLSPMPAEGNMAAAVAFGMVRAALRATEAGKDGAR